MKLLALAGGTGWHIQDLLRASLLRGDTLHHRPWPSLVASIHPDRAHVSADSLPLDQMDAILVRTMPPGVAGTGGLEQIVFRMDVLHRLHAAGIPVINPPRAVEAAVDKFLASSLIHAAGLPVPPTVACQRLNDALDAFDALGSDVVVKPIFGSEGFGITRVTDRDIAGRVFSTLQKLGSILYLQKFIDHTGEDLRFLVLGDRVLAAMRRDGRGDWRTNIARGGVGEAIVPDPALANMAVRASRACHAWVAGVDILLNRAGQPYVIEVNGVPGWRELARVTQLDIASEILEFVRHQVRSR